MALTLIRPKLPMRYEIGKLDASGSRVQQHIGLERYSAVGWGAFGRHHANASPTPAKQAKPHHRSVIVTQPTRTERAADIDRAPAGSPALRPALTEVPHHHRVRLVAQTARAGAPGGSGLKGPHPVRDTQA
jgi:hypothetical protein